MDLATSPSTITCATPACGAVTTLAAAGYIEGCGYVCPGCFGPAPEWLSDIEPLF